MNIYKAIIQWGRQTLLSHGYSLTSDWPENVQKTPWSYVIRFATSKGYIYLKHTPALLALEAPITQLLHDQFHAAVPEVIAHNAKLHCFLMKDAGESLRAVLKKQFDVDLLCKAIDQFTTLQLAVADHVDVFLDMGVPDWRLAKFPALFQHLLCQKELLIADGLSEIDISALEKLMPKVAHLCQKLSSYAIHSSIVQPDFNDNNTLINDRSHELTNIDLGEIAISHSFFSLLNFLHQIKKHHALTDEDDRYLKIKEACFKNFFPFESKENLLAAFSIAQMLWLIYGGLALYRLMLACDQQEWMAFQQQGKLKSALTDFRAACSAFD